MTMTRLAELDIKEHRKRIDYAAQVFESILVSSLEQNNSLVPAVKYILLSELVNSTIEYAEGTPNRITFHDRSNRNYADSMWKYLQSEVKDNEIENNIKVGIFDFVESREVYCPPDRPYDTNELYWYFQWMKRPAMQSTIYLYDDLINKVNEEILPSFSDAERKDVKGIGKLMRKHMDNDLEYIKKHYFW